jgi:hypothetical protein
MGINAPKKSIEKEYENGFAAGAPPTELALSFFMYKQFLNSWKRRASSPLKHYTYCHSSRPTASSD